MSSLNPNPIQAIAFDLDNTLIKRDAAFLRLITDWLSVINGKKKSIIEDILERDDHGHSDRDDFFLHLAQMQIFGGSRAGLQNRFIREFPNYFQLDSEIHGLLGSFNSQKIELALLTNGGSEMQRRKLKNADLEKFFVPEKTLISGEIGHDKPDPAAFEWLAEKLDTPRENTLFVGDHFENDILGASACGFQTCWISTDLSDKNQFKPTHQIQQLTDLKAIIAEHA